MAIGIDDRDWEPHKIKAESYAAAGQCAMRGPRRRRRSVRLALVGMRPEDVEPKVPA